MITMNDDDLGVLVRAADPLRDATPDLPDVRDEVRAALTWNLRHAEPADADPADDDLADDDTGVTDLDARRHRTRRRRLLVAAVAATGIAAAVAVPLVVPGGTAVGPASADARALHLLAATVRSQPVATPTSTRTSVEDGLSWVDTRTGRAYYRQRSVTVEVTTDDATTYHYTFDPPRFVTRADAQRARHVVVGQQIRTGSSELRVDTCPVTGRCSPTAAEVAALPTTTAGLQRSIARMDLGGCDDDSPSCRYSDIVSYLITPGVTAGTRAAAFDLLASVPGVTVLGSRTVAGRRGLAVSSLDSAGQRDGYYVFDVRDGSVLAQYSYLTAADDAGDNGPYPVPLGTLIDSQHRTG